MLTTIGSQPAAFFLHQMQTTCSDCQNTFELDLQEIPFGDDQIEVGFECPYCHTWFHSYNTNQALEKRRALLKRFEAKANRSDEHWQRYKRKKREFQQAFDRLNPRPRPSLAGAA